MLALLVVSLAMLDITVLLFWCLLVKACGMTIREGIAVCRAYWSRRPRG